MVVKIYPRFQSSVFSCIVYFCILLDTFLLTYYGDIEGMRGHTKLVFFCFYGWTTAEQMCASCVNEEPSVGKVSVLESVDSTWETEQQPGAADRTAGPEGVHFFPILSSLRDGKEQGHFPSISRYNCRSVLMQMSWDISVFRIL